MKNYVHGVCNNVRNHACINNYSQSMHNVVSEFIQLLHAEKCVS